MSQTTTLHPNGVIGKPYSFSPKTDATVATTVFCVAQTEAYVAGAVVGEGYETGSIAGEGC